MSYSYKEEERKSEEQRKEEEKKRKRQTNEEERSPEMESKKSDIEKGMDKGMAFGEAKPLTEVKYVKTPIKGMIAAEKYEPVVKEELAVKLIEEEHKKEEKRVEETRKEEVGKEGIEKEKVAREAPPVTAAEKIAAGKEEEAAVAVIKTKGVKGAVEEAKKTEAVRAAAVRRELIVKERQEVARLVEEARLRGMREPVKEIAAKLFEREMQRGVKPTVALGRVLTTLKKLKLLKKGDAKGVASFLKSLFQK